MDWTRSCLKHCACRCRVVVGRQRGRDPERANLAFGRDPASCKPPRRAQGWRLRDRRNGTRQSSSSGKRDSTHHHHHHHHNLETISETANVLELRSVHHPIWVVVVVVVVVYKIVFRNQFLHAPETKGNGGANGGS